jgi:hypothetical protein
LNPALPLLLVLSVLPLARKRDGLPLAWCVAGLAGMLLLAPALVLPTGIPSPAASAGAVAPWAGTLDPANGNPTLSDVTFQIQPWLLHLRRELRAGRLPFWNPYQFAGAPFWSNGQSAPLFPLHLLFAVLPVQLGLVLLPWLRVTIAGAGAWALARQLDTPPRAALVAAIVFPLSGMFSSFVLFPMANALCLVPWVLRETELLARRRGSGWRLGAMVGFQALGGHPETVAHTALLAALYLVVRRASGGASAVVREGPSREGDTEGALAAGIAGRGSRWRGELGTWARFVAALTAGGLVAGVQLLPLYLNLTASSRWQEWSAGDRPPASALLDSALRLVLPDLFGHPAAGTWHGPFNYNATAVFAGVLALPLAWAGLRDRWSDPRWKAVAALTAVSALAAYQVFPLRELLLLVPVVGRMLHHRLLFAVDLGLALGAAAGVAALGRVRPRSVAAGSALVMGALVLAWGRQHEVWRSMGQLAHQARWTAWTLVALVLLVVGASLAARRGGRAAATLGLLAGAALLAELVAAHARTNPGLAVESLLPSTPAIEQLTARDGRIAALDATLRPNAAMVHRLRDVRGDDTLKAARYEEVYRSLAGSSPYYFEPIVDWTDPWLDRLGVRWVLAPGGAAAPVEGWSLAFDGADARVYERPSALPLVRWSEGGGEGLVVENADPGRWTIQVATAAARTVVVAETWDEGWQGWIDGRPMAALESWKDVLIAAEVSPGTHTLRLRYRPRGLWAGMAASALGVALLVAAAARDAAARRARLPNGLGALGRGAGEAAGT